MAGVCRIRTERRLSEREQDTVSPAKWIKGIRKIPSKRGTCRISAQLLPCQITQFRIPGYCFVKSPYKPLKLTFNRNGCYHRQVNPTCQRQHYGQGLTSVPFQVQPPATLRPTAESAQPSVVLLSDWHRGQVPPALDQPPPY